MKSKYIYSLLVMILCSTCFVAIAQTKKKDAQTVETLKDYFTPVSDQVSRPDSEGFIRRWTLLEPISKPNSSNRVYTDSYLREAASALYFNEQFSGIPYDGMKITTVNKEQLYWHSLDAKNFYVNLLRFAEGHNKQFFGQVFWAATVINCEEDLKDVRIASGANSAAVWFLDEEEVLLMSNDRDLIVDDCMSKRLTLTKGQHIIRVAIFIGPGMADFCLRIVDNNGKPIDNYTIASLMKKQK